MNNRRWMVLVAMGLVCSLLCSGCGMFGKKKKGAQAGENIGGVSGSELSGEPLGARMEGGTEVAGQFTPVYFDYDSSQINESERSKIESVAQSLKGSSSEGVIIEGNCDERGSSEYNLALGERRALAVRAYLIGLGVDGARVQTKSYGEERPVGMGHDESAWSQNRRCEFVLVK
jgi:peptidoglycan-associated lipoprotein